MATQPKDRIQPIRDIHAAFDRRLITYQDFRNKVGELSEAGTEELDDIFLEHTFREKNNALFTMIGELKKKYKIGLLSNVGTSWIRDEFLTPDEQQLFDSMVFSFEVGYTKPDLEIYKLTAGKLSTSTENCMFIDDAPINCEAAKSAGMQAIVYINLQQLKIDLAALL